MLGRSDIAYAQRTLAMLIASGIFWPLVLVFYARMTRACPDCRREGWRGHIKVAQTLFGNPGIFRAKIPEWLAWFRRDFHPWQQDNSHHLALIDDLIQQAGQQQTPRVAVGG